MQARVESEDLACRLTLMPGASDGQSLRINAPEKSEVHVKADIEKQLVKQPRTRASCSRAPEQKRWMSIGAIITVLSILILGALSLLLASGFTLSVGSAISPPQSKYVCRSVAQNAAASS